MKSVLFLLASALLSKAQIVINPLVFGAPIPPPTLNIGFAPFGTASIPQIWHDNDDSVDCYDVELLCAAATRGAVILRGISTTTSTSANGYNPYVSSAVADGFYTGRLADVDVAIKSGFKSSLIPTPSPAFKGNLARPGNSQINSTTPLSMPTSAALVAAINANATPENPMIVTCGGTLTLVANAYLQDQSIADKVVVSFISGSTAAANGYNEWADGWAAYIVYSKLTIVTHGLTEATLSTSAPSVPKARLLTDFPVSLLRSRMFGKDHPAPGNTLPGDYDADGAMICFILDRLNVVTFVSRKAVTGLTTVNLGVTHDVPAITGNASGNIWAVTVNTKAMTNVWWQQFQLATW